MYNNYCMTEFSDFFLLITYKKPLGDWSNVFAISSPSSSEIYFMFLGKNMTIMGAWEKTEFLLNSYNIYRKMLLDDKFIVCGIDHDIFLIFIYCLSIYHTFNF